jgi:hypothetical protein
LERQSRLVIVPLEPRRGAFFPPIFRANGVS